LSSLESLVKGKSKKQLAGLDVEEGYKKGFLAYVTGISGPLLASLTAEAPTRHQASAMEEDNQEE